MRSDMDFADKVVLIIGASSGIGRVLALRLAGLGARVAVVAGREDPGFIATDATSGDGMPAPLQLSEARAVDHFVRAIRGGYLDYAFPWPMAALVRLANILPKRLIVRILRRDVPRLPAQPCS